MPDSASPPEPRRVQVVRADQGAVAVVAVSGELDLHACPPLRQALATAAGEGPMVVLDVTGVTFADSTFLNVLLLTHRVTDLRLAGMPEEVRRLLEITGTDQILQLFPTVADAAAGPGSSV